MQTDTQINVKNNSSRITVIDAMRGIALIGICLTHAMQYFGAGFSSSIVDFFPWEGSLNEAARWFIQYFVAAKFYIIFSLLFGLSFFIQMDRASQKGIDFRPRFLWRLVLLLVIGMLHSLVFRLDILIIYAILGFPLVLMYKLPNKILVGLALFFMLGGVQLGVVGYKALTPDKPQVEQLQTQPRPQGNRPRTAPTFKEMVVNNATGGLVSKFNYQIRSGRIFVTLGLFILGLVVGRIRLFHSLKTYQKKLYIGAGFAAVALFLLYMVQPHVPRSNPDTFDGWLAMPVTNLINLLSAYLWIVFIVWIYRSEKVRKKLASVVSYGRMGLTNYILQSVLGVFLFFGFGFAMNQYLGTFFAMLLCLGYTLLQLLGSHYWLKKFRYGPLEWLWRSGTYLKWQPLKR